MVVVLGNGERAAARVPPTHKSDRFWFRQALVSEKQQEMNVGHVTLEQASIIDRHYCGKCGSFLIWKFFLILVYFLQSLNNTYLSLNCY
ncbi:hypothetical protein HanPSC8_Chr12g0539911 [Helianthus annuus]|nr:hypothetical protein HanPSC8_Chr12g0539911 [Helianthus annuus]